MEQVKFYLLLIKHKSRWIFQPGVQAGAVNLEATIVYVVVKTMAWTVIQEEGVDRVEVSGALRHFTMEETRKLRLRSLEEMATELEEIGCP